VHTELQNMNWARNISDLDTTMLVEEFVILFIALEPVQLNQEKDVIKWRWTNDGISLFARHTIANSRAQSLNSRQPQFGRLGWNRSADSLLGWHFMQKY
jgi:hypothetical protein